MTTTRSNETLWDLVEDSTQSADLAAEEPDCLEGRQCVPWYEKGLEPDMCLEGIGICSTPA